MRRAMAAAAAAMMAAVAGCAGMMPVKEGDQSFSEVYEAPGASKDQIFTATKIWIAENFRSAKAVIEYENPGEGTLIGNGAALYPCSLDCISGRKITFTMRVDMKDGKFRLTFSNLGQTWPPTTGGFGGVMSPGYDGPINTQGVMDTAKEMLLAYGPRIAGAVTKHGQAKDW